MHQLMYCTLQMLVPVLAPHCVSAPALYLYLQHAEYELFDEMCVCAFYVNSALEQVRSLPINHHWHLLYVPPNCVPLRSTAC
jgi:hypothetical protein